MNLLAIDTALEDCSVAIMTGSAESAPVTISETVGRGHAERLFGMVEAAMRAAGLAFADLNRIAVTTGPGSFTGLRVGIAAARGLALVIGCPAIGVGTLAVHAETARRSHGAVPVLALLDARRGELYGQRFAADGTPASAATVAAPEHFAALAESGDRLAGSGAELVAALLPATRGGEIAHRRSAPDIADLCRLAWRAPADADKVEAAPPRPLYLRPPDAKPQHAMRVARQ